MSLEEQFAAYVTEKVAGARDVAVTSLERIHGGASRQTYRLRLAYEANGERFDRPLILRKDPPASLIDTERDTEFAAYNAFFGTSVPVPEPLWLENDEKWVGTPFFVMHEVQGFEASPTAIGLPPYDQHHARLSEQKWSILGEIAKADPVALGLDQKFEGVERSECWRRELDYWAAKLERDKTAPQPIMDAAVRWCRRTPPAPPQTLGVVHGDYRTGNFLYDEQGNIHAILDWEMAHLGDPLEDLAWSLNKVFHWARDDRSGGLAPRETAIETWERSAGRQADAVALHWWEVFSAIKGQAIWLAAGHEFVKGTNRDPVLSVPTLIMANSQDRAALELLGKLQ